MAESILASLCVLVFLAVSVQCELSSRNAGSEKWYRGACWVQFYNSMIDVQSRVWFDNLHVYDRGGLGQDDYSLPESGSSNPWIFYAENDLSTLETTFHLENGTGYYKQDVLTWTREPTGQLPFPCAPACSWVIDHHGFSLSDLQTGGLTFVTGWIPLKDSRYATNESTPELGYGIPKGRWLPGKATAEFTLGA